jgi:hypothetical protein
MSTNPRTSLWERDVTEGRRRNRSFSLRGSSLKRPIIHLVPDSPATRPGKVQSTKKTQRKTNETAEGSKNRRRLPCKTTKPNKKTAPATAMTIDRKSARTREGK